jgi:membrane-associated protein
LNWLDAKTLIDQFGNAACVTVAVFIFLETAFLPASFLPGDSLLFILGLTLTTAQQGPILLVLALLLTGLAAFGGSVFSYEIGARIGASILERSKLKALRAAVEKANSLFERHGLRALILARFTPVIRALAPLLSGMAGTPRQAFMRFNLIGSVTWTASMILAGWLLGSLDVVKQNLNTAVLVVVVVTSLPFPIEVLVDLIRARAKAKRAQN